MTVFRYMNKIIFVALIAGITIAVPGKSVSGEEGLEGSEVMTKGDKTALSPADQQFVDFCIIFRDYPKRKLYVFKNYSDKLDKLPPPSDILNIGGYVLHKIDYTETLYPHSTGALKVTFWKSSNADYFFRVSGGCVWREETFFGPFRLEDKKFVFINKQQ